METRFSRAPGTMAYCSRMETTQNKMMSGIFLALATIHMFVQEKKVGARRRGCLLLKKSLFVPATVVRLFREFILKVQLPQQHGQGQYHFGVCQHSSLSSTRCESHTVSACGRTGIHWTCWPTWADTTFLLIPVHFLRQTCLMETSTDTKEPESEHPGLGCGSPVPRGVMQGEHWQGEHLLMMTQAPHVRRKRWKDTPVLIPTELPEITTV